MRDFECDTCGKVEFQCEHIPSQCNNCNGLGFRLAGFARSEEPPSEVKDKIYASEGFSDTVLDEAKRLIHGDRTDDYGSPLDNFTDVAKMWSILLGAEVSPDRIPLCMIALKMCRELHKHKNDNLVDICGFAGTLEMLIKEREERA